MATKKPSPGSQLFEELFDKRPDPLLTIAEGIQALLTNAQRLYADVEILVAGERYASANFLRTVMNEELGKIYVMLDMLKLDAHKHESTARSLCRGFYQHGVKAAYMQLNCEYRLGDMKEAGQAFNNVKANWTEGDWESGEPDMPNFWATEREWSLYVDLFPDSASWYEPTNKRYACRFKDFGGDLDWAKRRWCLFESARCKGDFSIATLEKYHDAFSKYFLTQSSGHDEVLRPVAEFLGWPPSLSADVEYWSLQADSPLFGWPLYSFV